MKRHFRTLAALCLGVVALVGAGCGGSDDSASPAQTPPNILLIISDDVGIDQMEIFGYGGFTPPSTPNLAGIADQGIRFHNTWAMPACSTSRAVLFEGRFPLRTNVLGALGPDDLANSMVSPYEMTVPKVLAQRGYESALFGKFHLGIQGHDPAGYAMPANLGWNYFAGWLDETGDPSSIDTTAGGVAPEKTWPCGFVGGLNQGGADFGACYLPDGSCEPLASFGPIPPGRTCRDGGGIFDPRNGCAMTPPDYIDFSILSAHYVSPLVINNPDGSVEKVPPTDPRSRKFRGTYAVDAAVDWINSRPSDKPWMATVSFATAHTPVMQPPTDEIASEDPSVSDLDCSNIVQQRVLTNLMIESMDYEIGRLLVETGLAERGPNGELVYRPEMTNTMVIFVDDNGSLGAAVKVPFDIARSKGTAYQTGVWVPLIVAGPLVNQPDRVVNHMVNIADLFELFGEIAGVDVHEVVPRTIDSFPMLPYLKNPEQESIRSWNFTQLGVNLQANGTINQPCVITGLCSQIPVSKSVCEDNAGVWWGAGADDPSTEGIPPGGLDYCCEVNQFRDAQGEEIYGILPLLSVGIRNQRYKIVQNSAQQFVSQELPCDEQMTTEFYEIDEAIPVPKLDKAGTELPLDDLTPEQQSNFDSLLAQLEAILDSQPPCPGDGNIDSVVNQEDLDDWRFYNQTSGLSSWYDFNIDGLTNEEDEAVIEEKLGLKCDS